MTSSAAGQSGHRHTVLVVDDEPEIRDVFIDALTSSGHRAAAAAGGVDALRLLHDGWEPCLVMADVIMPGMNGYELRSTIERDPELDHIPIVVVSSHPAAIDRGATPKPMVLADLDHLIDVRCTGPGAPVADGGAAGER